MLNDRATCNAKSDLYDLPQFQRLGTERIKPTREQERFNKILLKLKMGRSLNNNDRITAPVARNSRSCTLWLKSIRAEFRFGLLIRRSAPAINTFQKVIRQTKLNFVAQPTAWSDSIACRSRVCFS